MSRNPLQGHLYWYAPFDNAGELAIARALAPLIPGTLVVQSCDSRFGKRFTGDDQEPFTLVRDLPSPAGESGEERTRRRRLEVARAVAARLRRRLIASVRPTLIHLHTYNPITDWYEAPWLCRGDTPVIQSVHNVRPHASVMPKALETAALTVGYRSFDRLIVAHRHLASRLTDEFGVNDQKIRVVPLPVVAEAFEVEASASHGRDNTTFLFFGTLRENKGIEGYVRAIELLDGNAALRFVFAGRGDTRLETLLRELSHRDASRHGGGRLHLE